MVNIGEIALAGLGLVLVGGYAEKVGAGPGLAGLGVGVQEIIAAPGKGIGAGLTGVATGVTSLGGAIGGIGKGLGELFGVVTPFLKLFPDLVTSSGGSGTDSYAGGGGNVPYNVKLPVEEDYPVGLPKGLGRIYEVNGGVYGFRYYPGVTFESRREARDYLKGYSAWRAVVQEGVNV